MQALEEEFFRQGDGEKEKGLSVSPLMDREKNGITKSQVGFFDIVALPLFQTFAQAFSESTPMLEAVKDNYYLWREDSSREGSREMNAGSSGSVEMITSRSTRRSMDERTGVQSQIHEMTASVFLATSKNS